MADDPNVKPPEFDPAAFKTELIGEFTKLFDSKLNSTVNNAVKNITNDFSKKFQPIKVDEPPPGDTPPGDTPPGNNKPPVVHDNPTLNAELQNLRKTVTQLEKKTKDAEDREQKATSAKLETERITNVRNILNDITFKDGPSREFFFKATVSDIKRDDNGDLIAEGPNGPLPAKDYLIGQSEQLPHLLAPQGRSGAGATAGTRGPGNRKWTMADLTADNINALKPDERAELGRMAAAGEIK